MSKFARAVMVSFVALVSLGLAADPASAQQGRKARESARNKKQQTRSTRGMRNGQITHREKQRLMREQARIRRMENKAKADGKVSAKEAAHIEHAQDKASKDIYRAKHNDAKPDAAKSDAAPAQPTTPDAPSQPTENNQ